MSASLAKVLQGTLEAELEARSPTGVNAEAFLDGEYVWCGAVGERAAGETLQARARFPAYSITKTFTAVCTLRLSSRGELDLDAPIERWLPELPFASRVSLRALLGHTAGVVNYSALPEYHEAVARTPGTPWSFDEFVAHTCHLPLDFEPGQGWAYSNTGYTLVKRILEIDTGASFADVVRREACEPVGLDETSALETQAQMSALVPGYSTLFTAGMKGPPEDVRDVYHPGWCGTGVLASTSFDLCRFFEAVLDAALLEPAAREQMLRLVRVPGSHPPAVTPSYGLGIMADPNGSFGPEYGHGGGGPGWSLRTGHWPQLRGHRFTLAVLCNHDEDHATPVQHALARSAFEDLA